MKWIANLEASAWGDFPSFVLGRGLPTHQHALPVCADQMWLCAPPFKATMCATLTMQVTTTGAQDHLAFGRQLLSSCYICLLVLHDVSCCVCQAMILNADLVGTGTSPLLECCGDF